MILWRTNLYHVDPSKLTPEFLQKLHLLERYVGRYGISIIAHYGVEGEHVAHSAHYKGLALDCHMIDEKNYPVSLIDQFLHAERIGFVGIGLYPNWNPPGIHIDMREHAPMGARWVAKEHGVYYGLTSETLLSCIVRKE